MNAARPLFLIATKTRELNPAPQHYCNGNIQFLRRLQKAMFHQRGYERCFKSGLIAIHRHEWAKACSSKGAPGQHAPTRLQMTSDLPYPQSLNRALQNVTIIRLAPNNCLPLGKGRGEKRKKPLMAERLKSFMTVPVRAP